MARLLSTESLPPDLYCTFHVSTKALPGETITSWLISYWPAWFQRPLNERSFSHEWYSQCNFSIRSTPMKLPTFFTVAVYDGIKRVLSATGGVEIGKASH